MPLRTHRHDPRTLLGRYPELQARFPRLTWEETEDHLLVTGRKDALFVTLHETDVDASLSATIRGDVLGTRGELDLFVAQISNVESSDREDFLRSTIPILQRRVLALGHFLLHAVGSE